jgi:hypothetical protein
MGRVIATHADLHPCCLQAMDRAHRLGQTRRVVVYRLLMRHTLEEKIMSLQVSDPTSPSLAPPRSPEHGPILTTSPHLLAHQPWSLITSGQAFKLHVASTVVSTQNAALATMQTVRATLSILRPLGCPSRCLLSAVCCLLSAVCCLLSAVCWLLSAVCWLLAAGCWLLAAVCRLDS